MARGHLEMVAAWQPADAGCAREYAGPAGCGCDDAARFTVLRPRCAASHGVRCVGEGGVGRSTGWGEGGV